MEYLWDPSAAADPEVERLERALKPLAHDQRPLELPAHSAAAVEDAATAGRERGRVLRLPRSSWWSSAWRRGPALAAAAALVVALGIGLARLKQSAPTDLAVTPLQGAPRIGRQALREPAHLAVGRWLETDGESRARVDVGEWGEITLEPNSKLRAVRVGAQARRVALARGSLQAFIVAPPRMFQVDTPSANTVDLGCAYTLEVADDGKAVVTVTAGWVSFEWKGREAFIPAGMRCDTRPRVGPGTPYRVEANRLQTELAVLDDPASGAEAIERSLRSSLDASTAEDAVTLWHLLARFDGSQQAAVFDRLAILAPPPEGVTREGVLRGDRAMLDSWWNSLGIGEVDWWRLWQSTWSPPA